MNQENSRGPRRTERSNARSAARARRCAQAGIHGIGAHEGAVHRQHHARGEHRVDEGVGIAQQQVALAVAARRAVGVVAGGLDLGGQRGALEPLRQRRTQCDGREEEIPDRDAAGFEVVRPHHGADTGRAIVQRNEPEPAVIEPVDRDVARALALVALGAAEMAEHGGAVVLGVAPLDAEAIGQKGVAARGIDQVARLPALGAPAVVLGLDAYRAGPATAIALELDAAHAAAFDHLRAHARGVTDQDLVELGAPHLVGVRHRFVPGVRKAEVLLPAVPVRDEFRAPFLHADRAHLVGDAELLEQRQVGGQQRLADMEARVAILLDQRDPMAAA